MQRITSSLALLDARLKSISAASIEVFRRLQKIVNWISLDNCAGSVWACIDRDSAKVLNKNRVNPCLVMSASALASYLEGI